MYSRISKISSLSLPTSGLSYTVGSFFSVREIETCLNESNSEKAYQLIKDLTLEIQGISTTIQNKSGKFLTDEEFHKICSEAHNHMDCYKNAVFHCNLCS